MACTRKHPGELCHLEFDPLFGSQDVSATELSIQPVDARVVAVTYTYPSTGQKIKLLYQMQATPAGWRITDVIYVDSGTTLRKLLRVSHKVGVKPVF